MSQLDTKGEVVFGVYFAWLVVVGIVVYAKRSTLLVPQRSQVVTTLQTPFVRPSIRSDLDPYTMAIAQQAGRIPVQAGSMLRDFNAGIL